MGRIRFSTVSRIRLENRGKLRAYLQSLVPVTTGITIEQVALEAKYKEGAEFLVRKLQEIISDENRTDDASSASFASM